MKIFDTHAHYYDKRFESDVEGGADAILQAILPDPVAAIVNVGTNCENSRIAIAQAAKYEGMYAAVGIHPGDCHAIKDADAALSDLERLLQNRARDKIVALGEIGLDYYWKEYDGVPMDKRKEAYFFDAQMELAEKYDLPVLIHDRDAHGDSFETVLRHPNVRGVFHSYSSSPEMARELVKRGWYLSFSGTLTFKNANRVRESAKAVPKDRLLIETDAPYLSPHPHRGKINHSGRLVHSLEVLSALWGCTPNDAAEQTFENAQHFFFG